MKEVIMSYSHRPFTLLILSLASFWLFALVEAQKSPPSCSIAQLGQIRADTTEKNGSCGVVNLTNIEVCEEDGWREICDSALSDEDAQVICRELGYLDIGARNERIDQLFGGFPTTSFPVCNGDESKLSECPMESRSGGDSDCTANKIFVNCYMIDVDATMCGIPTEPPTISGSSTTNKPSSSTSAETLPQTSSVVDSSSTTNSHQTEHITSTRELGTSQQSVSDQLNTTVIAAGVPGAIVVITLILIMCVILIAVCYKRTQREKNNNQVSPDSPVKVRKSDETDSKDLESGMYSELNNTVAQHQVPIYESVNKSQNLSEMSATESTEGHNTYALLDSDAIYTQIAPHVGSGKSSTLPAGLSGPPSPSYYQKLDHSMSLPRSTAPPSSSSTEYTVTHAVNRTALALESGNINEMDLASPTQSDSSVKYPSPRGSPKQHHSSSAKYPSPRGSPKQFHSSSVKYPSPRSSPKQHHASSQSSTTSKEEAPLIQDQTTNHTITENYYHVLDPEVATPAVYHQKEKYDNESQASTDAVCNQQVISEDRRPRSGVNRGSRASVDADDNRHLYAILDPSNNAQYSPPSRHDARQRSQSTVNNRSPPRQQRMYSHSGYAAGLDHRVAIISNKYSPSPGHSSDAEGGCDPQMDTLV